MFRTKRGCTITLGEGVITKEISVVVSEQCSEGYVCTKLRDLPHCNIVEIRDVEAFRMKNSNVITRIYITMQVMGSDLMRLFVLHGYMCKYKDFHRKSMPLDWKTADHSMFYLSEDSIVFAMKQIGCAVDHLHGINIIHGDIKMENVLVDSPMMDVEELLKLENDAAINMKDLSTDSAKCTFDAISDALYRCGGIGDDGELDLANFTIKLCDFGNASECNDRSRYNIQSATGTSRDIQPEYIFLSPEDENVTTDLYMRCDVWSVGMIFLTKVIGNHAAVCGMQWTEYCIMHQRFSPDSTSEKLSHVYTTFNNEIDGINMSRFSCEFGDLFNTVVKQCIVPLRDRCTIKQLLSSFTGYTGTSPRRSPKKRK